MNTHIQDRFKCFFYKFNFLFAIYTWYILESLFILNTSVYIGSQNILKLSDVSVYIRNVML